MLRTLLGDWHLALVPVVALAVVAGGYLWAVRRVNRSCPAQPWPHRRTVCLLAGLATAALATLGPTAALDDEYFSAHMAQHILLTMLAVPLVVLGEPMLLALRASPRETRRSRLVPVYRSRAVHVLTHPVLGWVLFTVVMVGSHVPAVYDFPLRHPLVHDYVEHPVYVGTALLFFYPLLAATAGTRAVPPAVRLLSLFTVMAPASVTGFFIYVLPHVAYPFYAHTDRPFGLGALADQQLSGALMWSSSMIFGVVWVCLAGAYWLRHEAVRTRRADRVGAAALAAEKPGWST